MCLLSDFQSFPILFPRISRLYSAQSMKKRQREDVLRKVVENRGQVLSNDDKQLVRNPAVTIIQTQNKICLPGKLYGWNSDCYSVNTALLV